MLSLTMNSLRGPAKRLFCAPCCDVFAVPSVNISNVLDFPVPADYSGVELPERQRLPVMKRVPLLNPGERVIKGKNNLALTRGPEMVNNMFLHKQYGIVALEGGRLRYEHFEMIRMSILKRMTKNMFAMWRVDDPWQPISQKSQGKPMGGGKSPVDHYATPVRAGRVIVEMGGHCTYDEVKFILFYVASRLPFAAKAYDYKTLLGTLKLEELKEKQNKNPYTFKYCVQNNMRGCHDWIRPIDKLFFGRYCY